MTEARILKVDLSNRTHDVETLPGQVLRHFLGGRGLGAYLLCRAAPPRIDPLSEQNHVIFTAGPGSGTGLFFGAKSVITTKSPLTGLYMYAISSGTFCHQLRKAGFWAVDIAGASDSPVYLSITNRGVAFVDARPLWGMEVAAAQRAMMAGQPRTRAATVAIGPGGEKLITSAAVMAEGDYYRAFGRCGSGAVMGSKKLKGLIVCGEGSVAPADPDRFLAAQRAMLGNVRANKKWADNRRVFGTGADLEEVSLLGTLPTRNWNGGSFEGAAALCTANVTWPRKNLSCAVHCPAPCSHYTGIDKGPYAGAHCDGPEYETIYALGSNCGIDRFDAVVAAAQICDEHGLDTMSVGVTIGFAMECFEKGLLTLEDADGLELRFGHDRAMVAAVQKLVNLEGFGKRLALGTRRLSEQIPGSEAFAIHVKGLELGGYECRGLMGQALQFAINNRGGCHHSYGLVARSEVADGTRMTVEGKGESTKRAATGRILRDSIITCTFPGLIVTDKLLPDIVSSLYGETWTKDDLGRTALRIMCQERVFNVREGLTRKDDVLPPRLLREPKPDGPTRGATIPLEELKDQFYRAVGWDPGTGNPGPDLLARLGVQQ